MTSLLLSRSSMILLICSSRSVVRSESLIRAFRFCSRLRSRELPKTIASSVEFQVALFRALMAVVLATVSKFSWFEASTLEGNLSCSTTSNDWSSAADELFLCVASLKLAWDLSCFVDLFGNIWSYSLSVMLWGWNVNGRDSVRFKFRVFVPKWIFPNKVSSLRNEDSGRLCSKSFIKTARFLISHSLQRIYTSLLSSHSIIVCSFLYRTI